MSSIHSHSLARLFHLRGLVVTSLACACLAASARTATRPLDAQSESKPAPSLAPDSKSDKAAPSVPKPLTPEELNALARDASFRLVVTYKSDERGGPTLIADRVQTGWFISADGLALTHSSALCNSNELRAFLSTRESRPCQVKCLAVDASLDLALLRVDVPVPSTPADASAPKASAETAPRDSAPAVHALSLAGSGSLLKERGWTLTPAWRRLGALIVEPTPLYSIALVPPAESADGAAPTPIVLRVPHAFDPYLGGAPIVDAQGQLLGTWAWSWRGKGELDDEWIDASSVRAFVEANRNAKAMSKEQRKALAPRYSRSFPTLEWKEVKDAAVKHGELEKRSRQLPERVRCEKCVGEGFIDPGDILQGPEKRHISQKAPCENCKQRKLKKDRRDVQDALNHFAKYGVEAACTGKDAELAADDVENGIKNASQVNRTELLKDIRDGMEILRPSNAVPGQCVAFAIDKHVWEQRVPMSRLTGAPFDNAFFVHGLETGDLILRVAAKRQVEGEGVVAFVVGTIAGTVSAGDSTALVLERCMVVPYKTADVDAGH